jgi:hypothetical protein
MHNLFSEYPYYGNTVAETFLLMDFVYHLARNERIESNHILSLFIVKNLLTSYFDIIKSIQDVLFQYILLYF